MDRSRAACQHGILQEDGKFQLHQRVFNDVRTVSDVWQGQACPLSVAVVK
jgi:hypothetical protein